MPYGPKTAEYSIQRSELSRNEYSTTTSALNEFSFSPSPITGSSQAAMVGTGISSFPSPDMVHSSRLTETGPQERPTGAEIGDGYFPCQDCPKNFSSRGALNQHRRCHIPMESRPYKCDQCDQRYQYPKDVRRHATTHGTDHEDLFFCTIPDCRHASKGFNRWDNYLRHLRNQHQIFRPRRLLNDV